MLLLDMPGTLIVPKQEIQLVPLKGADVFTGRDRRALYTVAPRAILCCLCVPPSDMRDS